jgi:hypothetical protein
MMGLQSQEQDIADVKKGREKERKITSQAVPVCLRQCWNVGALGKQLQVKLQGC